MHKITWLKNTIYREILVPIFGPFVKFLRKIDNSNLYTYNLISLTTDVTKIPKAQGPLRIFQQADAILLKQVIEIFEKHNISYWLMAGTLLGAVRHKGFIPWDADIDIAVISEDYEKLAKIFEEEFTSMPNFSYKKSDIIKVFYKNLPLVIDIEPFYVYSRYLDDNGRKCLKKKLKDNYYKLVTEQQDDGFESYTVILNKTEEELKQMQDEILDVEPTDKKMIIGSFRVSPKLFKNGHMIFDYDWIFPLKKGDFEGITCNIPNNIDLNLMENYGKDYMYLPFNLKTNHYDNAFREITPLVLSRIIDFIEEHAQEAKNK